MDSQQAKIIIKKIMSAANIPTQKMLAEVLGISQPTITKTIKEGRVPDRWIEVIAKRFNIDKAMLLPEPRIDISAISHREAAMQQNTQQALCATEQDQKYAISREKFKEQIAARFDPIFEWMADDFSCSAAQLEIFMTKFMAKFLAENPDYRYWLYAKGEKKQDGDCPGDGSKKKALC